MRIVFLLFVLGLIIFGSSIAAVLDAAAKEAKEYERKTIESADLVCKAPLLPDGAEIISYTEQQERVVVVFRTAANSLEIIEGETASSKELKVAARQIEKVERRINDYPVIASEWNSYHNIACNTVSDPSEENRHLFVTKTLNLPIRLLVLTSVYGQMNEELLDDLLSALPEDAREEIEPFLEDNIGNAKDLISDLEESLAPEDTLDQFGKWFDSLN